MKEKKRRKEREEDKTDLSYIENRKKKNLKKIEEKGKFNCFFPMLRYQTLANNSTGYRYSKIT